MSCNANDGAKGSFVQCAKGPVMILEVLNIINMSESQDEGKTNVCNMINTSGRDLHPDTKYVLKQRGFTKSDIPIL